MKSSPYLMLLSCVSSGLLLVLNWNLRPKQHTQLSIEEAQTLVALGMGKPDQLKKGSKIASEYLSRDPLHPTALFVQAWAQQRLGQPREAIINYQTALPKLKELSKFSNYNLAVLLDAQGSVDAALGHLLDAARIDPEFEGAWVYAAGIFKRTNRLDKALETATAGLGSNPNSKELKALVAELTPLGTAQ